MGVRFGTGRTEILTGTDDEDLIFGAGGGDTLLGAGGDDWMFGGGGGDLIFGDTESGPLAPRPGSDPNENDEPGDNFIFAGNGADTVFAGYGSDWVYGGAGDDVINGHGGTRFLPPFAIQGAIALDGADWLYGGAGADTVNGGGGADTLDGGSGQDLVQGNYGADLLKGGEDADIFFFTRGTGRDAFTPDSGVGEGNRDIVVDFQQSQDKLDLSGYRNPAVTPSEEVVFRGSDPFLQLFVAQVRAEALGNGSTLIQVYSPIGTMETTELPGPVGSGEPSLMAEIELRGQYDLGRDDFIL